ncbi:glutathione S-transferase family protein [Pseudorhodobacter sp. E13]|uniref:glutathione S-transferase family protein n=1 Tax=Pseudorhodobacter sp. E13 TaxID=2487931 RepID=UPI000F8E01FF|nr:glutathione S-transferase family protein [Pseudorhodobacter sp. E13]RUS59523.1 glutathione S-transferase family protein [Pseudorhodobacter sp. E13]
MLTLYHAAPSRSSRILTLADELGITDQITLKLVDIARNDGKGGADPANPHPEGKVPLLDHDGALISETAAIMLYLTDLFPSALAPQQGDPQRGPFLTWLFWYGSVMEPVLIHSFAGLSHPILTKTFRGTDAVEARLRAALQKGPWLLGDHFTAADLLVHSPYAWFSEAMPDDPLIADWVARCIARPASVRTKARDAKLAPQHAAA